MLNHCIFLLLLLLHQAPKYFPTVNMNHTQVESVWRETWELPPDKIKKGLCPDIKLDIYFAGFPTLKHMDHKVTASVYVCVCSVCSVYVYYLGWQKTLSYFLSLHTSQMQACLGGGSLGCGVQFNKYGVLSVTISKVNP